ncbi:amino acid adenylation protein [Clostridia bacterium]|nr:amino acid adenylation protein [Clostridia bacterium]
MNNHLIDWLNETAKNWPDRVAYEDRERAMTFQEAADAAAAIGTALLQFGERGEGKPVAVLMKRSPAAIAAAFGVLSSSNYFIPLDEEMGIHRIRSILEKTKPAAILSDFGVEFTRETYGDAYEILDYETLLETPPDKAALAGARKNSVPTDPAYVIFTSGSTGTPKGIVASHGNVISYLEAAAAIIRPHSGTVLGLQVALCVDFCLLEVWFPLLFSCRCVFLPKEWFLSPVRLVEFMRETGVNTLNWVSSALVILSSLGILKKEMPKLETVIFGGEVMPPKHLTNWRRALADTRFLHCYGPTETTGYTTYFEVPKDFPEDAALPIGKAFDNARVFLLSETNQLIEPETAGETGEICVSGPGVSLGYFCDPEQTAAVFVQNPLNPLWREVIYRTGDLAHYDGDGDLHFLARKDFQIKHMGYRIDLPEIEAAALRVQGIEAACCFYIKEKGGIILYYLGTVEAETAETQVKALMPRYMQPSKVTRLDAFPYTESGKTDRKELLRIFGESVKRGSHE